MTRPTLLLLLLAGAAALLLLAGGADAAGYKKQFSRHLIRANAQAKGTRVWVIQTGERGETSGFGFAPENTGLACFPYPDDDENGGCVQVTMRDGARVWFAPNARGTAYPELTQRPQAGEPVTADGTNSANRNAGTAECRDYVKLVLDEKRAAEAVEFIKKAADRRCHNEYLGASWDPTGEAGKFALQAAEAKAYRARLVALAALGGELSAGAAAHLEQNALLAYVDAFDGKLAAEGGYEALPAFWGLYLVRPHAPDAVRRALEHKDPVWRLSPTASKKQQKSGGDGETFTMYGAPGRSDRQFVRVGDKYTATVLGGGLELARPHLPDVAPEHQDAVIELLEAAAARPAGAPALLPFNGDGGLLEPGAAVRRFRAFHEKRAVADKLGGAYTRALGAFARPLAALTLYVTERTGRLLGEADNTETYRAMLARPFGQLVYVNEAESVERVPVASYGCERLLGAENPDGCRPPVPTSEGACSWDKVLHADAGRWKRYESSKSCTARRFGKGGKCATPEQDWFEVPVPRPVPAKLAYLERYGYFEFDERHDARSWQAAAGRLGSLDVPPAVKDAKAAAAYRLVYSVAAALGTFLASDDGGMGRQMNVGLRGAADWGNWNLRCSNRARWAGRDASKGAECLEAWETPVWNDLKDAVVLLDAVQRVAGLPCGGKGAAAAAAGDDKKDGAYVAGAAKALSQALGGVMERFFGLPLASAGLSAEEPQRQRNLVLFNVRGGKAESAPRPLCGAAAAAGKARFAEVAALVGSRAGDGDFCGDDEVKGFVSEVAKLRARPPTNKALRGRVANLREQFGAALRHIFREYVGADVKRAGYEDLASLFTGLPDEAVIPDGGDKAEKEADKRKTDKIAREEGVPGDDENLAAYDKRNAAEEEAERKREADEEAKDKAKDGDNGAEDGAKRPEEVVPLTLQDGQ